MFQVGQHKRGRDFTQRTPHKQLCQVPAGQGALHTRRGGAQT